MAAPSEPDHSFAGLLNLADPRLGAATLSATDDFFAAKERLLNPEPALYVAGKFDDHGKWMDGWESRRKRGRGYDQCIIRLGQPGRIDGVDIDTSYFTGNFPAAASLEACRIQGDPDAATAWTEVLAPVALGGNAHHFLAVQSDAVWSHVRLNMFPDGGIARLRVYGRIEVDWAMVDPGKPVDLAGAQWGARVVGTHGGGYGPPIRMLMPWPGVNMSDAWETRRRREPGFDWAIVQLGHRGRVARIEIDTAHHKGNFPDRCAVYAADLPAGLPDGAVIADAIYWQPLLTERAMEADKVHAYAEGQFADLGAITHVRVDMIPDGGISRFRLWGMPSL